MVVRSNDVPIKISVRVRFDRNKYVVQTLCLCLLKNARSAQLTIIIATDVTMTYRCIAGLVWVIWVFSACSKVLYVMLSRLGIVVPVAKSILEMSFQSNTPLVMSSISTELQYYNTKILL